MHGELLDRRDKGLSIIKAASQSAKRYFMDISEG